ncbi:MAG: glycosyltransferase family 39 protein [Marinosulfonomonas sp.]|nr:glycosyltransferase family 39 protein [Marinosulfonomonas sp.]
MPARAHIWLFPAVLIVGLITGLRLIALFYSQADIFAQEAQYWLLGQRLEFGYYSEPPLLAWVIRATTDLAASNTPFWVRLPAPVFHALTALILAAVAGRLHDARAAIWTAVTYLTIPLVSVGSIIISSEAVMAPFIAMGLLFYLRLTDSGHLSDALLAGLSIGLAVMANYTGVYFLLCVVLTTAFAPRFRISAPNAIASLFIFALVVSPNIYWTLANDINFVGRTLNIANWGGNGQSNMPINFVDLGEFLLSQFFAIGPFIFATLIFLPFAKRKTRPAGLLLFALPIIALACFQALLSRATVNLAFAAYPAVSLVAVIWLIEAKARWLWMSLLVNGAAAIGIGFLATQAESLYLGRDQPILAQYLGRDEISREILELADTYPGAAIVSDDDAILADLFLTRQDRNVLILSAQPIERSMNYYQRAYPLKPHSAPVALFVTTQQQVSCTTGSSREIAKIDTDQTAYAGDTLRIFRVSGACLRDLN